MLQFFCYIIINFLKCETVERYLVVDWICERFRSMSKFMEMNFTTSALNLVLLYLTFKFSSSQALEGEIDAT